MRLSSSADMASAADDRYLGTQSQSLSVVGSSILEILAVANCFLVAAVLAAVANSSSVAPVAVANFVAVVVAANLPVWASGVAGSAAGEPVPHCLFSLCRYLQSDPFFHNTCIVLATALGCASASLGSSPQLRPPSAAIAD